VDVVKIKELIQQDKLVKFYQCPAWYGKNGIRQQALERDNYECVRCKAQGKVTTDKLQVHHIKEVKDRPDLALVLSNVETLCLYHHNEEHDRLKEYQKKKPKFENVERW